MSWSIKKLNNFYNTEDGNNIKTIIQQEISSIINSNSLNAHNNACCFGYDIMNKQYDFCNDIIQDKQYNFIISCHCEETSHSFHDLIDFCNKHLIENGICILITPNNNGFWDCKKTPFAKHRSYKNIKTLKRIHFKILRKKPILCAPIKFARGKLKPIYTILNKLCTLFTPSISGAYIITAQKQYINIDQEMETQSIVKNSNKICNYQKDFKAIN